MLEEKHEDPDFGLLVFLAHLVERARADRRCVGPEDRLSRLVTRVRKRSRPEVSSKFDERLPTVHNVVGCFANPKQN